MRQCRISINPSLEPSKVEICKAEVMKVLKNNSQTYEVKTFDMEIDPTLSKHLARYNHLDMLMRMKDW